MKGKLRVNHDRGFYGIVTDELGNDITAHVARVVLEVGSVGIKATVDYNTSSTLFGNVLEYESFETVVNEGDINVVFDVPDNWITKES